MKREIKNAAVLGIGWMIFASTLFAIGNVFVKAISPRLPHWEPVFVRSLFALIVVGAVNIRRREVFRGKNKRGLVLRGLLGTGALMCYYYAISATQLGVAVMLAHTAPLFTSIFAFVILKEKARPSLIALIVLGFGGATLILSPNLSAFDWRALVALVAAGLAGGAYTTLRYLRRYDQPATIVFYYALIATLLTFPFFVATFVRPTLNEALMLLGVGVTSTLAQFGLTYAYRHAQAALVSPFSYWTGVVSFFYGITLFGEIPASTAIIGAVIVTGVGAAIAVTEHRTGAPEGDHAVIEDEGKV